MQPICVMCVWWGEGEGGVERGRREILLHMMSHAHRKLWTGKSSHIHASSQVPIPSCILYSDITNILHQVINIFVL